MDGISEGNIAVLDSKVTFIKNNAWILTASVLGGAGLYLLRIVLGRVLTPTQYGQFSTVASLLMIMGFLVGAVGYTATKLFKDVNLTDLIIACFFISIGFTCIIFLFYPLLLRYLELTIIILLVPILVRVPILALYQPVLGFHQKERNFRKVAISEIVEAAFLFLVSGLILLRGTVSLMTAVLLFPLASLASTIAILPNSPRPVHYPSISGIKRTFADLPNSIGINSVLLIPTTFDMLIVSAIFTGSTVGFWGVLTVFGKAYIVITRAISRVMFPDTTADGDDFLIESVILCSLLGTSGAAMGILLSDFWVVTLFGQAYSPVVELLPRYMLMMLPYPAIALVGIHLFGSGDPKGGVILFSMVLILYLSTVAASTLSHLIWILAAGHYSIFFGIVTYKMWAWRRI